MVSEETDRRAAGKQSVSVSLLMQAIKQGDGQFLQADYMGIFFLWKKTDRLI